MLQKEWNIIISHQSIENTLLNEENEFKPINVNKSGYYVFDIEHVHINKQWNFRYAILDAKLIIPIADEIFPDQKYKTIESFLLENLKYCYVNSITTDGQKEFRQILSKIK